MSVKEFFLSIWNFIVNLFTLALKIRIAIMIVVFILFCIIAYFIYSRSKKVATAIVKKL